MFLVDESIDYNSNLDESSDCCSFSKQLKPSIAFANMEVN
jgi:hypothetical protein